MVDFSPLVPALPETGFVPDQPPEAVQELAPVDDHARVAALPIATHAGLALNVTVGDAIVLLPVPLLSLLLLPHAPRKNETTETTMIPYQPWRRSN
ncbi:MAG: hypothetical protein ACYDBW_04995 [Sulfuricaulis sp.]